MQIRNVSASELESVRRFLCDQGWAHRVGDPEEFAGLIANSQRTAVAIGEDGEVVGFARGITDGQMNGYLSMVAVAPEHRRKGIGRALVQHVMGDDPGITWVLRAGRPGAMEFFAKLGFAVSAEAMERKRT